MSSSADVEMKDAKKDAKAAAGEEKADATEEASKAAEAETEKPKQPEKPKELEEDAAPDKRPKVSSVGLSATDATLNVIPTCNGKFVMPLTDGGMQYLLAGVRANTGIKAGRYMFEVRIVETLNPMEQQGAQRQPPQPRNLLRVGLSLAGSSRFLAESAEDSVAFDSEGNFLHERKKTKVANQGFKRDHVIGLVVNLDQSSPNANTVSLFRNGVRACQPQKLPENLVGKTLFPTIAYKNVTVHVHWGPEPCRALPFACRTLGDAAKADTEANPSAGPKGGKCEVVFPVGLPDTGLFDWVDDFLAKHPDYEELSDRKILEWAQKSGLGKSKGGSNDKPAYHFGIPAMDDFSVRRMLNSVAPLLQRNYVVAEVKANLIASDRKDCLQRFGSSSFKKTAHVMVGEPSAEYKQLVQNLVLTDKRKKAEAEQRRKKADEERKRKAEALKAAAQRKKEGKEEEEETKESEDVKVEEEPVVVELTDEEKALRCRKIHNSDLTERAFSKNYTNFSLPVKEEGFDGIVFEWQKEAQASNFLKEWMLEKKTTQKVEDLQPGAWFKEQWAAWQKELQSYKNRHAEWKDPNKRKRLVQRKKDEHKKQWEAEKKERADKGDEGQMDDFEEYKPQDVKAEDVDVFSCEDVNDVGSLEPLYSEFAYEDWALLSARFEFHLLLHAFKKDLNDPDRPTFCEGHASFYYNKYFKKDFALQAFNVTKMADFLALIKGCAEASADGKGFLQAVLPEDTTHSHFVKMAEDNRRERQRRLDAGDETAELKFKRHTQGQGQQQWQRKPWGNQGSNKGGNQGGNQGGQRRPAAPQQHQQPQRSWGQGQKRPYQPQQQGWQAQKFQRREGGYGGGASWRR